MAYLAPLIQQILAHKQKVKIENQFNSPLALVIVPGRELADQIGVCIINLWHKYNSKLIYWLINNYVSGKK